MTDFRVRVEELTAQHIAAAARYRELVAAARKVLADAEARLVGPTSPRPFLGDLNARTHQVASRRLVKDRDR
jgi:hypothetical protein